MFPNLLVDERDLTNLTDMVPTDHPKQAKKQPQKKHGEDRESDEVGVSNINFHGMEGLVKKIDFNESHALDFLGSSSIKEKPIHHINADHSKSFKNLASVPLPDDLDQTVNHPIAYSDKKKAHQSPSKETKADSLMTKPKEK